MLASKKQSRIKNSIREGTITTKFIFRLFVSGRMHNSIRAIKNFKEICEQFLKGNYELEVIDIYQQPELAINEGIIVVPILIIKRPLPERRIIGDLSDRQKVMDILNF